MASQRRGAEWSVGAREGGREGSGIKAGAMAVAALVYFFAAAIVSTYLVELFRGWWLWTRSLENDRSREEKRTLPNRSKPSTKRLSIVIPAYNEEKRLPSVLKSTLEYLVKRRDAEGSSFTYEIVVVDDGSTDQTAVKVSLSINYLSPSDREDDAPRGAPDTQPPFLLLVRRTATRRGCAPRKWERRTPFGTSLPIVSTALSRDRWLTTTRASLSASHLSASPSLSSRRVFQLQRNSGKGAAVRTGCLNAEGDLVLMMDADGATELAHGLEALEFSLCTRIIKKSKGKGEASKATSKARGGQGELRSKKRGGSRGLIQEAGGYAHLSKQPLACFGSRAHLEQEDIVTKRKRIRNFAMHGFHLLVFLVVGGSIRDTQCGFKLFTREAAFALFQHQRLKRWCFDVEIINIAKRLKVPILEVQVKWEEKEGSKLKFTHVFHMALELLTVFVCYNLKLWRIKTAAL